MLLLDDDPSSAVTAFHDRRVFTGKTLAGDDSAVDPPSPVKNEPEKAGFDYIVQEIASLLHSQDSDDDEEVSPTFYAIGRTFRILKKIFEVMHRNYLAGQDPKWKFPKGFVSTDEYGGLRIEWWHERTHCITLAVGHDEKSPSYVFIKRGEGDKGVVQRQVFPAWLASRLGELNVQRSIQG